MPGWFTIGWCVGYYRLVADGSAGCNSGGGRERLVCVVCLVESGRLCEVGVVGSGRLCEVGLVGLWRLLVDVIEDIL